MKKILVLSILALLSGCATYYVVPYEQVPTAVQAAPVVVPLVYYTTYAAPLYYPYPYPYYGYYPYYGVPMQFSVGVGVRLGGHRR